MNLQIERRTTWRLDMDISVDMPPVGTGDWIWRNHPTIVAAAAPLMGDWVAIAMPANPTVVGIPSAWHQCGKSKTQ